MSCIDASPVPEHVRLPRLAGCAEYGAFPDPGLTPPLDEYARTEGFESRSAVVHSAVRILKSSKLGDAYGDAWKEWADSDESEVWDAATGDGLT